MIWKLNFKQLIFKTKNMLLTLICSFLFLSCILLCIYADKKWYDSFGAYVLFGLFSIWFIVNGILLCTSQASTRSDIQEFEAARTTIAIQRSNKLSEYERVQLTQIIVEKNTWLAHEQFWAKNIWLNWYYDKSILSVKPIE